MAGDRARRLLFGLAAMGLAMLLLALLGEAVARVAFPDHQLRYQADPQALFRLHPDQVGFLPLLDGTPTPMMHINELGLRGPAVEPAPRRHLLVLGDSFMFGSGVRDDETLSARLDAALGERVQVVNGGVPGYGIFQMQAALERLGERIRPEQVLLVLWQGDLLRRPPSAEEREAFLSKTRRMQLLKSSVLVTQLYRVFERAMLGIGATSLVVTVGETEGPPEAGQVVAVHLRGWREDSERVRAMQRLAQRWGGRLVLVLWPKQGFAPNAEPGLEARLSQEMGAFAAAEGIPFVSLRAALEGEDPDLLLIPEDWHPTAYAHCLAARFLLSELGRLGFPAAHPIACRPAGAAGG
jgi:hypothetical protein